ncbi:hypothetical protein PMSD_10280 [Paenibacillus macquariensis subsp. defensor]|nr:hypothetical protein PMSD_10280 [Paenibacillus macquariensis subsp. defensor]
MGVEVMMKDTSRRTHWCKLIVILCIWTVLHVNVPHVSAADRWDTALAHIDIVYDNVTTLKGTTLSETQHIQEQRTKNNDALKLLNVKINAIDVEWVKKLQIKYDQSLREHSPLLEQYTGLSKQATAAKEKKNKKMADLLDLQRNKLRASVDVARADIKAKKAALSTAKKQRASKVKVVKDALAPVQVVKKQITSENKTIAAAKKIYSAAEKSYKASVKQGDAVTAATDITLMYDQMVIIHSSLQKEYDWEKKIAQTIVIAEYKLPK